jgi:hypothetical protein
MLSSPRRSAPPDDLMLARLSLRWRVRYARGKDAGAVVWFYRRLDVSILRPIWRADHGTSITPGRVVRRVCRCVGSHTHAIWPSVLERSRGRRLVTAVWTVSGRRRIVGDRIVSICRRSRRIGHGPHPPRSLLNAATFYTVSCFTAHAVRCCTGCGPDRNGLGSSDGRRNQ